MKKLLIGIAILLAFALNVEARMNMGIVGGSAAAAASYVLHFNQADVGTYIDDLGTASGTECMASRWTENVGHNYTLKRASVYLRKLNSPVANITLSIYATSGTAPAALAETSSTTLAAADLTTSMAWVDFDFATGVSIVNTTTYWAVLTISTVTGFTNYVRIGIASGVWTDSEKSADCATWTDTGSDAWGLKTYTLE
jgi:hypothetical protein